MGLPPDWKQFDFLSVAGFSGGGCLDQPDGEAEPGGVVRGGAVEEEGMTQELLLCLVKLTSLNH